MPTIKLTKTQVDLLGSNGGPDAIHRGASLPGFGVRLNPRDLTRAAPRPIDRIARVIVSVGPDGIIAPAARVAELTTPED